MDVKVLNVGEELPEVVEIRCHRINAQVREIVAFVQSRQGQISGTCDGMQYEIEHLPEEKQFLRVSKSVIVNLMKIKAIKPALNGRFIAVLQNGEEVIISRKYVSALKNKLKEGK